MTRLRLVARYQSVSNWRQIRDDLRRLDLLIDGRNRLRACREAGVEPRFVVYEGADVTDYVVRVNIQRRHLTTGQKAFLAAELLPHYEQEAKARQVRKPHSVGADLPQQKDRAPLSRDVAAKAVGTSGKAVAQA